MQPRAVRSGTLDAFSPKRRLPAKAGVPDPARRHDRPVEPRDTRHCLWDDAAEKPRGRERTFMEFGILFTSHPNAVAEPYPHRDVHARVTKQIVRADELGYDYAWVAEHHFSNEYGIMPDVFVYAAYLAALTKRITIGTAVVTAPLANPLRIAENTAFVDILSNGRFALGLGSGYRKYEFDGFGVDFEARRDIQEELLPLLMDLFHKKRADHQGKYFKFKVDGDYEMFPHSLQQPHPPIFLAGATGRSIGVAARMGFGLFLSSWTTFAELAQQAAAYRAGPQ